MFQAADCRPGNAAHRVLPDETLFRFEKMVLIYKHGAEAIDSGSGPLRYMVVIDEAGVRRFIWAGTHSIWFVKPNGESYVLDEHLLSPAP